MTLDEINEYCRNTLIEHLGIYFTEVSDNFVAARMLVQDSTRQPMGYLHGGATLALAETVGSAGSVMLVGPKGYDVFGTQISGSHVASVRSGSVVATGRLVFQGKNRHIWDVEIHDELGKLISLVRVTNTIMEKRG